MSWYKDWFNSPYYHILYKHRDGGEAELFIDNLLKYLSPSKDVTFLDLACGKGRHSIYLNKKGFDVTGVDLSENSIQSAKKFENDKLHFYVHDIRDRFRENGFDYILNLFTSFGYFDSSVDDNNAIKAVSEGLKKDGVFVLDFFNVKKVISCLSYNEIKTIDGIQFYLSKKIEDGYIIKDIKFFDAGVNYSFQEKVKALSLSDFKSYFEANHLKILNLFGDYSLCEFDEQKSDRLIIVAKKIT